MRIDNMAVLLIELGLSSLILISLMMIVIKPFCKLILVLGGM
jgi:hypothetical protein